MDLGRGVETDWESDGADYLTSRKYAIGDDAREMRLDLFCYEVLWLKRHPNECDGLPHSKCNSTQS